MEDFIAICKERTTDAMEGFLHDLSFVPADKLIWKPTPTAKSALEIASHCAGYSGSFATIISAGKFPSTREEFRATVQSAIESIATLEQAETMLRKGIADSIAALETVKPEQIGAIIDAPHASVPFKFFLTLPAMHLETHAAQINYLQTCWGDQDVHL
jgi:hypothetical protein